MIRRAMVRAALLLASFASFAAPGEARAADGEREACVEASSRGQELRDDGKLIESKATFQMCARAACPAPVAAFCVKQLEDVERRMPTVVFRLRDGAGSDVSDASVWLDGALLTDRLTGASFPVNPGPHAIRFEQQAKVVTERTIIVNSGEKDRLVDATALPPEVAPAATPARAATVESLKPPPARRGLVLSTPALVGFGVGVAALTTSLLLVNHASARADELRTTCAPRCSSSDVDGVEASLAGANVAWITGAIALAFGTVWLIVDNTRRVDQKPHEKLAVTAPFSRKFGLKALFGPQFEY